MILALAVAAVLVTVALSVLTACAVAVRATASRSVTVVGAPPAGIGAGAVALSSGTGHALAGWFAPGRPGCGAVLLLHGIRSDRRALASRMGFLARAGFTVLAIDLRAHGESAGAAVTFGALEAQDAAGALGWLRAAAPGERAGAIGVSLGGAALLLASRHARIDALVLESVFPDIRDAIRNRLRLVAGAAEPWITPLFIAVGVILTGIRPADLRPIEALGAYAGPVLIVSGAEDRLTPPSETRAMYDAAPGPKQLWMVEGAGHVDMAAAVGSDYEGRILAFLGRHLQDGIPCA